MLNTRRCKTNNLLTEVWTRNPAATFFTSVLLSLLLTTAAFADILYLSPKGVEPLRGMGLAKQHPDGKRYFVRGQIIIQRDAADRPTLKSPGTYFLFRPSNKSATQQLEWAWITSTHYQIDTLDDLRGMLSNRDQPDSEQPRLLLAARTRPGHREKLLRPAEALRESAAGSTGFDPVLRGPPNRLPHPAELRAESRAAT